VMPKVLLATEKAFAADAVGKIEARFKEAGYELAKLENYKSKDELLAAVADAEAMIVRSDAITKEVFDAAKALKIVVRGGAGVDTIDLEAGTAANVCIMNTPGQNSNAVAELAFGMMLTTARNHFDGTSGYELREKTLALYGCGNVSKFMIKVASAFDMKVFAFDPYLKPEQIEACGATPLTSMDQLFESQFVSLHIPATDETKKSITEALMMKMPKNACLINTARKEVIDEDGLKNVFAARPDFTYIADVQPDSVAALKEVLGDKYSKRCFCTPKKMGAQTAEANNNAGVAAANQIVDFFEKQDVRFQVNKPGQKF